MVCSLRGLRLWALRGVLYDVADREYGHGISWFREGIFARALDHSADLRSLAYFPLATSGDSECHPRSGGVADFRTDIQVYEELDRSDDCVDFN